MTVPFGAPAVVAPVDTVGAFVEAPRVLAVGARSGPLAGTAHAVKDVIDVAGTVTGAGNPTFAREHAPAATHARAVELLLAAGSTVIGKTITDELAYSLSGTNVHYGTPVNRAAPGRIPGGSSAGSAAAVAAGLCDFALGTDTGGSIRVPASYCGIWGWRPTHGAVSAAGIVHLARSFDTVGVLAPSARRLATVATQLLDGAQPRVPIDVASAVRVEELFDVLEPELRKSVSTVAGAWTDAGSLALGIDLERAAEAFRALQGAEAWAEHGEWILRVRPAMGPGIGARFAAASRVTPEQVAGAEDVRAELRRVVADATAGGRVLVGPAALGAAPTIDAPADARAVQRQRTLQLTCLAGLCGAPVVVIPAGRDDGLPLGVACLGPPGSDAPLLRWAAERSAR